MSEEHGNTKVLLYVPASEKEGCQKKVYALVVSPSVLAV